MAEDRDEVGAPSGVAAPRSRALFAQGFLALVPLWTGAIPAGIAYGVAARSAGLGIGETQLMSVVVFSAAAQVSAASLIAAGAPVVVLVGTVVALNAQMFLLSLAVGRQLRLSWIERVVVAAVLTDGAFGVAAGRGPLRLPVLLGTGASMFVAWNVGTALGTLVGQAVPDPRQLGLDLVAPLAFLAVLVPLVRTRSDVLVALAAGATVLILGRLVPGGIAVLGAGGAGIAVGAWRTRDATDAPAGPARVTTQPPTSKPASDDRPSVQSSIAGRPPVQSAAGDRAVADETLRCGGDDR